MNKDQILNEAIIKLNNENQPWEVKLDGDNLIATWKYMDATFFGVGDITDAVKQYKFIVTLDEKCKWKEKEILKEEELKIGNGTGSFQKNIFIGKSVNKSITFGGGKDNETNEIGVIKSKFDNTIIKEAIRNYLKECGCKKAGLFG